MTANASDSPSLATALIPARGGSRGVPGKNVALVGGVPLVARAVASALGSSSIGTAYVSTDDADIADAARAAGATVIERPSQLADDAASSEAALLHALDAMPTEPEILVFIQATSPFIDPADLDAAVALVRDGHADSVFSAAPSHVFLWRDGDHGAEGVNHDASRRLRRQDSEPQYRETGAFYVMRTAGFRAAGFRFFGRVGFVEVAELGAMEIDSPDDLRLARALADILDLPDAPTTPTTEEKS